MSTLGSLCAMSGNTRPWHLTWASRGTVADSQGWKQNLAHQLRAMPKGLESWLTWGMKERWLGGGQGIKALAVPTFRCDLRVSTPI